MSALSEQLFKAGLISPQKHEEQATAERAEDDERSKCQFASIENRRVEELSRVLQRVTTLRRFRKVALSLLLLRPEMAGIVVALTAQLPMQYGSEELLEKVTHLKEWLPSLSAEERETFIRQTLK